MTRKSTMNGRLGGRPASSEVELMYSVRIDEPMPIASPPARVSGRLVNRPMAAAPKAWTMSRVRTFGSSGTLGASSTPDIAANTQPITQAQRRTRSGLVPARPSRSGSSTTARIALPRRAVRKKM
jgi:hypothetical protein